MDGFNPFYILPRDMMMLVLLSTFKQDADRDFKSFMNYKKVSKGLRDVISDKDNFDIILSNMPDEFNVQLVKTFKKGKFKTKEGRYHIGIALLFLKYIYSHVKPFPDDVFLKEQFDYYNQAIVYINEQFFDYPMVMYVSAYVSFHIAKRLFVANPQNKKMQMKGGAMYKLASECVAHADKLGHPIAKMFYNDMDLQFRRNNIHVEEFVKGKLRRVEKVELKDAIAVLCDDEKVNLSHYTDEDKTLMLVTWQKLTLENCDKARALFQFVSKNDKLKMISDFFYKCFACNHFHRHVLAYNPLFVLSDRTDTLLYLLESFTINSLINLHQGFRVYYPKPDSILLSVLLSMTKDELKDMRPLVERLLTFPQKGSPGWKMAFLDSYRQATDDGTLKKVSGCQMTVFLNYFIMIDRAEGITNIKDREVYILDDVAHCNDDVVHEVALAVIKRLLTFNSFDPLGHLAHQEILLSCVYQDQQYMAMTKRKNGQDLDKMAAIIVRSYKDNVAKQVAVGPDVIVADFISENKQRIQGLHADIHSKFSESGYLSASI